MFNSVSLTPAQSKYSQLEREGLAIIVAVKKFHKFLLGREWTLVIDNIPLKTLFSPSKEMSQIAADRIQRRALILGAHKYKIEYRKSLEMGAPDALSRLPGKDICVETVHAVYPLQLPLSYEIIAKETSKDKMLSKVLNLTVNGWPSQNSDAAIKPYFDVRIALSVLRDCVLFGDRVVVPQVLRPKVLELLHDGHPGVVRMKMRARNNVWWPRINNDIESHVAQCNPCAKVNWRPPRAEPLKWTVTDQPWIRLHVDFFYWSNYTFFLVIDSFSKWLELF